MYITYYFHIVIIFANKLKKIVFRKFLHNAYSVMVNPYIMSTYYEFKCYCDRLTNNSVCW